MRRWWTASDLAAAALPGLPPSPSAVSEWISQRQKETPELVRRRIGRGGGLELSSSALPAEACAELERRKQADTFILQQNQEICDAAEIQKRQIGSAIMRELGYRQRTTMEARGALLIEIESRAMRSGRGKKPVAAELLAQIRGGTAPEHLMGIAARANGRGGKTSVCLRSVLGWFSAREKGGLAALAPVLTREKQPLPDWFEAFAKIYGRPTKPVMTEALDELCKSLPPGTPRPSIDQVRRCVAKLSALEQARGRDGKVAIRRLQAYVSRDTSMLLPTSVYVADGTTADWEVAHPVHGRPFKPEITSIIDAATRACVGWSAGLSESTWVVADALRRAVGRYGVPAIFYSDRGPGYRNAAMDAPLTGIVTRLGCEHQFTQPRNAQAKGNVERFQKLWIRVAKRQATYTGRDMDREARLLAFKTTRREIALFGASKMLPDWSDFVWAVEDAIVEYNNTPHRGLPKTRDPESGRRRHATPAEAWAAHVAKGFVAIVPEADDLADMFRPYEIRRVSRCLVQVNTNSYFSTKLDEFHGKDVIVGYDIADGSKVWIRKIQETEEGRVPGRLICIAAFEGNKVDYVPATRLQRAEAERHKGRLRRAQDHVDEIEAEYRPSLLIEQHSERAAHLSGVSRLISAPPAAPDPSSVPDAPAAAETTITRLSASGRPIFPDDVHLARWLTANPDAVNRNDREYIRSELLDQASRSLLTMRGVDVDLLRSLAREPDAEQSL